MAHLKFPGEGPVIAILAAAVLFGLSTPLSKLLLSTIHPVLLAGLLYLGGGAGLLFGRLFRVLTPNARKEARPGPGDFPWLLATIIVGGLLAPIVLLSALQVTPAATAALLLNFEIVATISIAYFIFREYIGRNVLAAALMIFSGSILLSISPSGTLIFSAGAAGVLLASVFWGLDNNITRNISGKDPVTITIIKGLSAGCISIIIAWGLHAPVPGWQSVIAALVVGFFSFGVGLVLFTRSLRELGAARTGAYFAIAPFIGAMASLIIFREIPGLQFVISLPFFLLGFLILFRERHIHRHTHERLVHEHLHSHDEHHQHHPAGETIREHSHLHIHEPLDHTHSHAPDIHHRHEK